MHRGNERLRKKAEEMVLCYDRAPKKQKATIIDSITNELLYEGVRFLHCIRPIGQQQYWKEATKTKIRDKVSQELREVKNKMKREKVASVGFSSNPQPLYKNDSEKRNTVERCDPSQDEITKDTSKEDIGQVKCDMMASIWLI